MLRVVNAKSLASEDFRLLISLLVADVVGALQLVDELRPCKLLKLLLELELCNQSLKFILRLLYPQ